jgi:hypothetical protein
VGRDVDAVDVGIVLEFAVDLAERAHCARRFEGAGVDVEIVLADRVRLVGEIVEEAGVY